MVDYQAKFLMTNIQFSFLFMFLIIILIFLILWGPGFLGSWFYSSISLVGVFSLLFLGLAAWRNFNWGWASMNKFVPKILLPGS